ncbi:MAG: hypothetical protein ACRYFU_14725 [Janthinobacterium lividum]
MSHVTNEVPLGALRSRLDVLLTQYRPSLALDEECLHQAMRDFERHLEREYTQTQTALAA